MPLNPAASAQTPQPGAQPAVPAEVPRRQADAYGCSGGSCGSCGAVMPAKDSHVQRAVGQNFIFGFSKILTSLCCCFICVAQQHLEVSSTIYNPKKKGRWEKRRLVNLLQVTEKCSGKASG